MDIKDIQALLDNTATIYTKIDVLPKVAGESIITLTNEDSIKSWTYTDLRNVENQGFIGQFVARTLDGELQDISDDFNIEDREIVLYIGVNREHEDVLLTENNQEITDQSGTSLITELGTYSTVYYKLGNFFVEKPSSDEVKDSTKYKSMDYTILFNIPFDGDFKNSTYTKSFNERLNDEETVTALWLTQYTCAQVNVELGNTNFANNDFIIDSNQFDSQFSCRDVIKSIAKLAFTWARIGWDNKLYLDFGLQSTVQEYNVITNDNYYTLNTQKDTYGVVNRVLTGSSIIASNSAYVEDAQSIEDNGLTELDVYDNPILYTQELRESAIEAGRRLLGLTYQPMNIETTGHPWLLGNELIKVVDMEGVELYTYPLDRTIKFNGHIRTILNSVTPTKTQTELAYQGVDNESKTIKRSSVELDRQNQKFTVEIENLNNEMQDVTDEVRSILDTEGIVKGNPVNIEDCGEFLIENISFYGNLEQDGTPTPTNPVDVDYVEGNHLLNITSKNLLNMPNMNVTKNNISIISENSSFITINGSSESGSYISLNDEFFKLPTGTYTISATIEGDFNQFLYVSLWRHTAQYNTKIQELDFHSLTSGNKKEASATFTTDNEYDYYIVLSWSRFDGTVSFNNNAIKVQIEKGEEQTSFGGYVHPQSYEYDLNELGIYKINDYTDKISYNITDEKWYLNSYITKKNIADVVQTFGASDDNNIVFKTYDSNYSDFGKTFHILSKDFPCYSNYFTWGGVATSDSEALSKGVGIYTNILNINGYLGGVLYVVVPKSIAEYLNSFQDWCNNNNVNIWFVHDDFEPIELQNYDLVEQLNVILNEGKLYETNMIVEDVANDTGTTGDIEVNYLTNAQFNGLYASRAELKITQNSIESTVSETFTTSVQPVIDSVDTLGDQLQNTEATLQGNIDGINNSLSNYALNSSLVTVTNTVSNIQTALNQQILVSKELQENGTTKVTTTTGFTFDENGLAITKTGADTKTVIDEDGMTVYSTTGSSETPLLNIDSQGVETENLHVRTYTQIGSHSRLQDYEDGTAIFYIA